MFINKYIVLLNLILCYIYIYIFFFFSDNGTFTRFDDHLPFLKLFTDSTIGRILKKLHGINWCLHSSWAIIQMECISVNFLFLENFLRKLVNARKLGARQELLAVKQNYSKNIYIYIYIFWISRSRPYCCPLFGDHNMVD